MSDPNDRRDDWKRELECLRLASDLGELAKETLDPDLKAHCLRMAQRWSDEANEPTTTPGVIRI
ncbi:hypothetical protein [Bradyrhizobium sp.]|jgi:hypothetical protein|uniref:hypothetical protein n=1 Tax=Bradyrhizobium sp. TaxID=376 RepID=UPI003C512447